SENPGNPEAGSPWDVHAHIRAMMNTGKEYGHSPFRSESYWLPPYRQCTHGAGELALCPEGGRKIYPAPRRYRPGTFQGRICRGNPGRPALAGAGLGHAGTSEPAPGCL